MPLRRVVAALGALLAVVPSAAGADTLEPSQWPAELRYHSAPNALRIGGVDRYQTSLALALTLRGAGDLPFSSADRTSGGALDLAAADGWWGAATCPRAIIVVPGDTPADALAAASLSDPTNRSDQPRVERVAAADPFFDPIGGFDRVDTDSAPIIVTASQRAGARGLSEAARLAASDLSSGGCTTAREAIIVGGDAAVPVEVEGELVSLGYEEVFRVAGVDRYDTAAKVAEALGTEAAPAGATCEDDTVDDGSARMGFYGNSVIEYRESPTECRLLGRTVVLAEGGTGADALAAGWWTSRWQVPVLLVAPDGSLPAATRTALRTLAIDTIVVLGGTARIPEAVVDEAKALAGAVAGRFAGADRFATSVATATSFGGWFPTGDGSDFAGDLVCLAGSNGSGATAHGWPDALAAGPLCGRAAGDAGGVRGPSRALPPINERGSTAVDVDAVAPAHDAVPLLLVPAGAGALPASVRALLAGAFSPDDPWCTGRPTTGCLVPGFALAVGGKATVSADQLEEASLLVAGGNGAGDDDDPSIGGAFWTDLDLGGVHRDLGSSEPGGRVCASRGDLTDVRFLAAYADSALTSFVGEVGLRAAGVYEAGSSAPVCMRFDAAEAVTIAGVSLSGHAVRRSFAMGVADRVRMSGPMTHGAAVSSTGDPIESDEPGTTTSLEWADAPTQGLELTLRGATGQVSHATAAIRLVRGAGVARFTGTVTIASAVGDVLADVAGDAVEVANGWALAGSAVSGPLVGGLAGEIATSGPATLTWRTDLVTLSEL